MADFLQFLMGSPAKTEQVQRFTGAQQQGMEQLLSSALGGLQSSQSKFDFAPIEQQARTGLYEKTIPSILNRFTSMGTSRGSGLENALKRASTGFEENLASMKSQYGLQQQDRLLSMLGMGMQKQFDTVHTPESQGFLGNVGGGLSQGVGMMLPLLLGGGLGGGAAAGAAGGGALIKLLLSLLGGNS